MKQFGIVTPERAAMFVAQCAHESDRFKTSTEYASGAGYEGRRDLGNVHAGDGVRFKGRGRIMVTGRGNYTAVSKAMKRNFVARPDELATSPWSEIGSGWWWYSHGLNQICDQYANVEARLKAATYRINGGFNGLDDRRYFLQRARRVKRWLVPR
jgi:putative chitinase